jgi:hypothetical protein
MGMKYLFLTLLLTLPLVGQAQSLQEFFGGAPDTINLTVIPFLLGIAFVVFVWGAIKFFIFQSTSDEGRQNAKNLLIYSLAAFIFLVIFWGIVAIITASVGLEGELQPCPDYPVGLTRGADGACE